MTCETCSGLGLLIQEWTDAPHDFSICVCEAGQAWRRAENNGHKTVPQWLLWCARWQVEPERVFLLEDVYTGQELAAAGLSKPVVDFNREAALLAAGRRKAKL